MLRAGNIWVKPNPKPESMKDRPAQAHEHMFLFTKSERYFYDSEAVRELHATPPRRRGHKQGKQALRGQQRYFHPDGRNLRNVWVIRGHGGRAAGDGAAAGGGARTKR